MLSSLAVLQMRKSVNNVMKSCLKLRVPPFLRFLHSPHPYTHTFYRLSYETVKGDSTQSAEWWHRSVSMGSNVLYWNMYGNSRLWY